jgi:hypothetical protein
MIRKTFLAFVLFFAVYTASYSQGVWQLKRDQNGIQVYTRIPLKGNIKELRVVCELNASKQELISTLQDISGYANWVYSTKSNELLKIVNPHQLIYHSISHLPWPLSDRDLIVELTVPASNDADNFQIEAKSLPGYLPDNPSMVRVPYSSAIWKVKKIDEHHLKIDYTFSVDPGGSIPLWLVNSTLSIGPYSSFINLKKLLIEKSSPF